jgi:hypothetical protein
MCILNDTTLNDDDDDDDTDQGDDDKMTEMIQKFTVNLMALIIIVIIM